MRIVYFSHTNVCYQVCRCIYVKSLIFLTTYVTTFSISYVITVIRKKKEKTIFILFFIVTVTAVDGVYQRDAFGPGIYFFLPIGTWPELFFGGLVLKTYARAKYFLLQFLFIIIKYIYRVRLFIRKITSGDTCI